MYRESAKSESKFGWSMSDSENLADGRATSDVKRRVAYISSLECIQKCDCLPKVKGRVVYI